MSARVNVSDDERRAELARRHHLIPELRTDDVVRLTDDLVAVHSSDPVTVFLSLGARMDRPSVAAIETGLYEDRSVLRHHAMRRTLWVATPEMVADMHASSTRKVAATERRQLLKWLRESNGIDRPEPMLERSIEDFVTVVADHGPVGTRRVGELAPHLRQQVTVGSGTYAIDVGLHTRVAMLAALEGRLVRTKPAGSWNSSGYAWEPWERWTHVDLEERELRSSAAALLAHYLERFGPATEADIGWWTGWTSTQVRHGLADIAAVEVDILGGTAWLAPSDPLLDQRGGAPASDAGSDEWVALLPGLDPTTMGWKQRSWYLDDDVAAAVFDRSGNGGPTVWAGGRIVGGWAQRGDGSIAVGLLRDLTAGQQESLSDCVDRVQHFVGDTRFRVRFPSPNQKDLLGPS